MRSRFMLLLLFSLLLLTPAVEASQPEGYVGKLIANPALDSDIAGCSREGFESYFYFYDQQVAPSETVVLDLALIPFRSGSMYIGLRGPGTAVILYLEFSDGQVSGLSYHRTKWNDVTVLLRPATQDYLLNVNGAQAGPFPFLPECQLYGGCFMTNAIDVVGQGTRGEEAAWLDSLRIWKNTSNGQEPLFKEEFRDCGPPSQAVGFGGILLVRQPQARADDRRNLQPRAPEVND